MMFLAVADKPQKTDRPEVPEISLEFLFNIAVAWAKVNHLRKKLSQVAQSFTKQSKTNEGHTMQRHRPPFEVKIFLHLSVIREAHKTR